jgi:hypothetical protein
MNDQGINKIYSIKKSSCNYGLIPLPGTVVNLATYLTGSLSELEFEVDSFTKSETTENSDSGLLYNSNAGFTVSGITPAIDAVLKTLAGEPHLFVFADNEGQHFLMGTNNFKPMFTYQQLNNNPPNTAKNYKVSISLKSTHGFIFCTII